MTVDAPPRPPDSLDRVELEALVEALIEEARRRARRRRRRYAACAALLALVAGGVYFGFDHAGGGATRVSPAAPGDAATLQASALQWRPSRGPEGGPVFAVAVAPSVPSVVYVATGRGVFRSSNGGRNWTFDGLAGRQVVSVAVDQHTASIVYAASGQWMDTEYRQEIYKTTNGGHNWRLLGIKGRLVTLDPSDPNTVYVTAGQLGSKDGHGLFKSTDGGTSWHAADNGLPGAYVWALAVDPTTPGTLYGGGARGIFKSTDGGTSWRAASEAPLKDVTALAVDPHRPQTVYAGSEGGVLKSLDAGATWNVVSRVMVGDRAVVTLAVDPHESRTLYARTYCSGIFKSMDAGRSWRPANEGLGRACPVMSSPFAFDTRTPRTVFLARGGGVFRSNDGGLRWRGRNRGLSLTTISSMAVDHGAVYATTGERGLFTSTGGPWRPVETGLKTVTSVVADPRNAGALIAAGPGLRLVRSTDAGRTWQAAGAGIAGKQVTALALSGSVAYAGTSAHGIFKSANGGGSWHSVGPSDARFIEGLAISRADAAVVYAATAGSRTRGLYRSMDGGGSWRRVTDALADNDVFAVALDPETPTTVYIGTGASGVFKSTNGGDTWRRASAGLPQIKMKLTSRSGKISFVVVTPIVTALVIDPANPRTVYTATRDRGIFRTRDAGEHWHALNSGLIVLDVRALAIDASGRALYAGTAGGGVVSLHVGG